MSVRRRVFCHVDMSENVDGVAKSRRIMCDREQVRTPSVHTRERRVECNRRGRGSGSDLLPPQTNRHCMVGTGGSGCVGARRGATPSRKSRWRGGADPGARLARRGVPLGARAPVAAGLPIQYVSADVGTRVGKARGLGAVGELKPSGSHGFWCLCCRQNASGAAFLAAFGGERA